MREEVKDIAARRMTVSIWLRLPTLLKWDGHYLSSTKLGSCSYSCSRHSLLCVASGAHVVRALTPVQVPVQAAGVSKWEATNFCKCTRAFSSLGCRSDAIYRHMLWNKLHDLAPRLARQPLPALPVMHEAVVLEPEPAHMRRRFSGRYQS